MWRPWIAGLVLGFLLAGAGLAEVKRKCVSDAQCPVGDVCKGDEKGSRCVKGECPADYKPVCGLDGNTHPNACVASLLRYGVAYDGPCGRCGGIARRTCPTGQFCDLDPGTCGADRPEGVCRPIELSCPVAGEVDLVCGCGGRNYASQCLRRMARVTLLHAGPCAPPAQPAPGKAATQGNKASASKGAGTSKPTTPKAPSPKPETHKAVAPRAEKPKTGSPKAAKPVVGASREETREQDPERIQVDPPLPLPTPLSPATSLPEEDVSPEGERKEGAAQLHQRGRQEKDLTTKPCGSNLDCSPREYCQRPDDKCDDRGWCVARPPYCNDSATKDRVCGCDGVTYDDRCWAALAGQSLKTCPDSKAQ